MYVGEVIPMNEKKIKLFISRLQEDHIIYFRLYNATYKVKLEQEGITIHQQGLEVSYPFKNLKELLDNYIVYGDKLIDCMHDIEII